MPRTLLAALAALALLTPSLGAQARAIGPKALTDLAPVPRTLVASLRNPLIALAIESDGDLLRTDDGGATFGSLDIPGVSGVFAATFDVAGVCYIAASSGVHVSVDGARTFSPAGGLLGYVLDIEGSPHTGGEVWVYRGNGDVYASLDFGATWSLRGALGAPASSSDVGIVADPLHADSWVVHTRLGYWYTVDGGAHWATGQVPSVAGWTMDMTIVGDNWVALDYENHHGSPFIAINYSNDHGQSWFGSWSANAYPGRLMSAGPTRNEVWYKGDDPWFYRSVDGGQSFTQFTAPAPGWASSVAFSSADDRPIYVSTHLSLGVSDLTVPGDFTASVGAEFERPIAALAADPFDAGRLAVRTGDTAEEILVTSDGGAQWANLGAAAPDAPTPALAFDGHGRVYSFRPDLQRHDGAQWVALQPGTGDVSAFAASTADPDLLYAVLERTDAEELVVSHDGGATWTGNVFCSGAVCAAGEVTELRLVERPGQPTRVVLVHGSEGRVESTDDDGVTFNTIRADPTSVVLGQSPRNSAYLALARPGSLALASDGFDAAPTPIAAPYGAAAVARASEEAGLVFGATGAGGASGPVAFGLTRDGGVGWTDRSDAFPPTYDLAGLAMGAEETEVLVASENGLLALELRPTASTAICTQTVPNSRGQLADLHVVGSPSLAEGDARFEITGVPPFTTCLPLAADGEALIPGAGGSEGTLCLAGQIGRFTDQIASAGASGTLGFALDLDALPRGTGTVPAIAGAHWTFQCWYRDVVQGASTSNFTSAVAVDWLP